MAKKRISDITPKRRSIRNISLKETLSQDGRKRNNPRRTTPGKRRHVRDHKASSVGVWFIAVVSFLFLLFALSIFFSGATVRVTPRTEHVSIDTTLIAALNPDTENVLSFERMTFVEEMGEVTESRGQEYREQKASGVITIYNDHDELSQTLVKNTRFESPEGLIFRIPEVVTVPGQRIENGVTVPGSIDVTVFADEIGNKYNIGPSTFTIPGFEGDPRFKTFSARSTEPMRGGVAGNVYVVSGEDRSAIQSQLESSLESVLQNKALQEAPASFVLYPNAVFTTMQPLPDEQTEIENQVRISMRGTTDVLLFDRDDLEQALGSRMVLNFVGEPIDVVGIDDLEFALTEPYTQGVEEINFSLSGEATVVWYISPEGLQESVAGESKKLADQILSEYKFIQQAELVVRPFWRRRFPDESSDIVVEFIAPSDEKPRDNEALVR